MKQIVIIHPHAEGEEAPQKTGLHSFPFKTFIWEKTKRVQNALIGPEGSYKDEQGQAPFLKAFKPGRNPVGD